MKNSDLHGGDLHQDNLKVKRSSRLWLCYVLPLLPAVYLFGQCLYVMASRIFYPYELEWIEGGILQSALRIADGLPLYAASSVDYVPSLYAPLYFYLSSVATLMVGKGLPALRVVSVLAALLTALMVSSSVWQLTRSKLAALLALLCWGAMYRFSGSWYDLARVDSLWACCLTATVTALIFFVVQGRQIFLWLAMGALLLAVFTKQTTLMLLPFFLLAVWCWAGFKNALKFGVFLGLLVLIVVALLQWQSNGYFYFYTMQMAGSHRFNSGLPMNFLHGDLMLSLPIYFLFCVGFIVCRRQQHRDALAWLSLFAGYLLMSMLSRWYSGGFFNVLIPLHQLIVIMAISGFSVLLGKANEFSMRVLRYPALAAMSIFLALNILTGWSNPAHLIPNAADRACGDRLVERLSAVQGNVCVYRHGYLAFLAGKSFCAHEAFAADLLNGSNSSFAESLISDFRDRLLNGYYEVLLLDNQAQFSAYQIGFNELAYTATDLDCPADSFYPLVAGQRPLHWLQYNGEKMHDLRAVR